MADGDIKTDENDKAMSAARSAAAATLRTNHLAEYNDLLIKEAASRGLTWKPRPTKEERAKEEMARLLADYPDILNEVVAPTDPGDPEPGTAPVGDPQA